MYYLSKGKRNKVDLNFSVVKAFYGTKFELPSHFKSSLRCKLCKLGVVNSFLSFRFISKGSSWIARDGQGGKVAFLGI